MAAQNTPTIDVSFNGIELSKDGTTVTVTATIDNQTGQVITVQDVVAFVQFKAGTQHTQQLSIAPITIGKHVEMDVNLPVPLPTTMTVDGLPVKLKISIPYVGQIEIGIKY